MHKGAYDEIDTTYETITTYLDAKDIVAKDAFIEEFAADRHGGRRREPRGQHLRDAEITARPAPGTSGNPRGFPPS